MQTSGDHSEELRKVHQRAINVRQIQTEVNHETMGDLRRSKFTLMDAWANREWIITATWNTPWEMSPLTLYENLPKHHATAPILLRTEVIRTKHQRQCEIDCDLVYRIVNNVIAECKDIHSSYKGRDSQSSLRIPPSLTWLWKETNSVMPMLNRHYCRTN
jgi:hypothetical protein